MSSAVASEAWRPAFQTWDMRLINLAGRLHRRPLALDAPTIVGWAAWQTRLRSVARRIDWRPLEVLTESFANARLTHFGRLMVRLNLTHFVVNRLRLERARETQPALFERPVVRPMFIVGLPRTGTTLLHHLLGQNRRFRPLRLWESLTPRADPRRTGAWFDWRPASIGWYVWNMNRTMPQLPAIHALDAEGPEECTWLLANTFQNPAFLLYASLPRYFRELTELPDAARREAYACYRSQLQWIQAGDPDARFLTKSPVHLSSLDVMQETFPDGCFIQTHRDPAQVVGSSCSMMAVTRARFGGSQDYHEVGRDALSLLEWQTACAVRQRAEGDRVCDVHFDDLLRDPLGVVRRIYAHFDCEFDDRDAAATARWLQQNPQHKHGVHQYGLSDFGLSADEVQERFAPYCEHFGLAERAAAARRPVEVARVPTRAVS